MTSTQVSKAWSNPPNPYAIGYSLALFLLVLSIASMSPFFHGALRRFLLILGNGMAFLGRHSLPVFMYHIFFLRVFTPLLESKQLVFLSAILASLLVGSMVGNVLRVLRRRYPALFLEAKSKKKRLCPGGAEENDTERDSVRY